MGEGRVEIFYAGVCGGICSTFWGNNDAKVVCHQLGFSGGSAVRKQQFGEGVGIMRIKNVYCSGFHSQIQDCSFSGWGASKCNHSNDAQVVCTGTGQSVSPLSGKYGELYVMMDGHDVVCKQLGYRRSAYNDLQPEYGQGSGHIWMSNVDCMGDDKHLHDCPFDGWGQAPCRHTEDVGVVCETPFVVRLSGSSHQNQGRVQFLHDNTWGSICDSNWNIVDGHVVCRQLGYDKASATRMGNSFGSDNSTVWMDNVWCTGSQLRLQDCNFDGWGNKASHCTSSRKAGVVCKGSVIQTFKVRIAGGRTCNSGRVEIQYQGVWGTVCDDSWDIVDAGVVCRQVGFTKAIDYGRPSDVPHGTGHSWLDAIGCKGSESRLQDCLALPFGNHNCIHSEDAGVTCA